MNCSSLDEQIDQITELAGLKPIFFRVDELAKAHPGDFEVQLAVPAEANRGGDARHRPEAVGADDAERRSGDGRLGLPPLRSTAAASADAPTVAGFAHRVPRTRQPRRHLFRLPVASGFQGTTGSAAGSFRRLRPPPAGTGQGLEACAADWE